MLTSFIKESQMIELRKAFVWDPWELWPASESHMVCGSDSVKAILIAKINMIQAMQSHLHSWDEGHISIYIEMNSLFYAYADVHGFPW